MVAFARDQIESPRRKSVLSRSGGSECTAAMNVGDMERVACVIAGGLLILNAIPSRPISALLLGGCGAALVYRGITGRCECYQALGISTRKEEEGALATELRYEFDVRG